MKTLCLALFVGAITAVSSTRCLGAHTGTSVVFQPVNLGMKSDPGRIPLGLVGVISNYNYGIHRMIGEPRPCPDGAMRWGNGVELNQNLASVFGISVEPEDETNVPGVPVILRVRSWTPPPYSPYTRDQVLAATLWSLIRSAGGTPERPLEVRVVAEGPDDKHLEGKYSDKFVTRPGKDRKEVPPPTVPGTRIETDGQGIPWVVFPDVKAKAPDPPSQPAMILFAMDGAIDTGDGIWYLLPVWGNGSGEGVPYHLNSWPASMLYSCYRTGGRRDANSFLSAGGVHSFDARHDEQGDTILLDSPQVPQATLAANILALVIAAQPTADKPLTVSIRVGDGGLTALPAFRGAPGWTETKRDRHNIRLHCEFVWDAATRKLIKGTVPLVKLNGPGMLIIADPPKKPSANDLDNQIAVDTLRLVNRGIHDGTLLAEKNLARDQLAERGLNREVGKAGYYAGLATYCNQAWTPEDKPPAPAFRGPSSLDQHYRLGWHAGLNRGQAISRDARKAREEALRKKE